MPAMLLTDLTLAKEKPASRGIKSGRTYREVPLHSFDEKRNEEETVAYLYISHPARYVTPPSIFCVSQKPRETYHEWYQCRIFLIVFLTDIISSVELPCHIIFSLKQLRMVDKLRSEFQ